MPAFDPKRYRRIAVEEAYMIPEIAQLESTRMPGRNETSKLRAYIMKSLLEMGDERIKAMDETASRCRSALSLAVACRISILSKATSSLRSPMTASPR